LRLLVDEDSQARTLVRLLGEAGHDVSTAEAAGLNSLADGEILGHAVTDGRVLLTRNCGDFLALSAQVRDHHGILAVYQEAEPSKNMTYGEIVRATGNVETSSLPLSGEFIMLNAWRR
jgi:predicted nuclease of predicted toxin-antitoxin system